MAKIVEFYGSPGVGKSTIYEQLAFNWKKDYNWVPSHHLYTKNKIKFGSPKRFILTTIQRIKHGNIDEVAMKEAGERFIEQYPEFMDAFWKEILLKQKKGHNGLDLRLERAKYFYKTIEKIQILKESTCKKIALIDEGLIQRLSSGHKSENLIEETYKIKELLRIMPLPEALIYIEIDLKENAKRLACRKKVISMHKSLSVTELEDIITKTQQRMWNITNILNDKGIPILRVEAKLPISENVSRINSFVKDLTYI